MQLWTSNPNVSLKISSNHGVVMLKKPFTNLCVIVFLENLVKPYSGYAKKKPFENLCDLFRMTH